MNADAIALVVTMTEALAVAVIVYFVARLLLLTLGRANEYPSSSLITAMKILGVLGAIALLGGLFTSHESAYTVAAAVAGGLTGYLTAQGQLDRINDINEPIPDDRDVTPIEEPEMRDEWAEENPLVPSDPVEAAVLPEDEIDIEEGWTPTLPDDSENAYDPIVEAEASTGDQEDSGA